MDIEKLVNYLNKNKKHSKLYLTHEEINKIVEEEIDPNYLRWNLKNDFEVRHEIKITFEVSGYLFEFIKRDHKNDEVEIIEKGEVRLSNRQVKTFSDYENDCEFIIPKKWATIFKSVSLGDIVGLIGPKGSGKSRILEECYSRLGINHLRIPLGSYTDPNDLFGCHEVCNENGVSVTKFVPGILTESIMNGTGVILDEFDSIHPDLNSSLNLILENKKRIPIKTENGTEIIERHENSRIAITANTWGYGDDSGFYAGTRAQNRATWSRILPKIEIEYDYDIERSLVSQFLPIKVVDLLYGDGNKEGVINLVRKAIERGEIDDQLGMREILYFAKRYQYFGWHIGTKILFNEMKPESRSTVYQLIRTNYGLKYVPSDNNYDINGNDYYLDYQKDFDNEGILL